MAGTRSSSRLTGKSSSPSTQNNSSPQSAPGTKRKSDTASTSKSKRGKKSAEKEQKTIEETLSTHEPKSEPTVNDQPATENGATEATDSKIEDAREAAEAENIDESAKEHSDVTNDKPNGAANASGTEVPDDNTSEKDDTRDVGPKDEAMTDVPQEDSKIDTPQEDSKNPETSNYKHGETAVEAGAREEETPSSILEKGVIYFFFRARVNVNDPQDTNDIARSYIVLRPIPHGAKIGDGLIGDDGNCRLLALPKKVLPLSGKDRFMVFVEKANTSFKELKDDFMSASDYATKTAGTSHSPAVTPIGEGIYAITTTGKDSHLAYILTIPSELDEVQKDIGLRERGSFVTSTKNPEQKGPANASLGKSPEFPKEIMEEFRGLRWMPLQPKHLDYPNAQFLIIGESKGLDHATEALDRDQKHDKETPLEEMEKLEGEDEIRVNHLKGDDTIFADLGLSSKEYPKLQTTW